jgi:tRNA(Phe) wybutosine-synthesizing methylase Tyw3
MWSECLWYELGKIFTKSSCSGRHKLVSANIRNCRGILYVWLGESLASWEDDIKVDLKKTVWEFGLDLDH